MRVLVADQDADVRDVIADLLAGPEFEVRVVASSEGARRALEEGGIDVFLCDLELLRAQQGRLRRFARSLPGRPRLVAMSASGNGTSSSETDRSLAKPFSRSQLLAAIVPSGDASSSSRPAPIA